MKLVLATRNRHKTEEIGRMLAGLRVQVATLDEYPGLEDVEEDGDTLEANATKKAVCAARATRSWCLADDTGLEVEALRGAPGVYSARYAGAACDFQANNAKLLRELKGVPPKKRSAVFRTVMALCSPEEKVILEEGRLAGMIGETMKGVNGFGYDPVFVLPDQNRTLAELTIEEKNELSHRARALIKIRSRIEDITRKLPACSRCGMEMEPWHCRQLCPGCGFQIDCSDNF